MTDQPLIEKVARAMAAAADIGNEVFWQDYRDEASAAIVAVCQYHRTDTDGVRIVTAYEVGYKHGVHDAGVMDDPGIPTSEMVESGAREIQESVGYVSDFRPVAKHVWRAMLRKVPSVEKDRL